jgi:exodeoxyribonuclease-5
MLSCDQETALRQFEHFIEQKSEPVFVLQGYAGTGKTFLLQKFLEYLEKNCVNYALCSPTHKAKRVIEKLVGRTAHTLHALLSLAPNVAIFKLDYNNLKFKLRGETSIPTEGVVIVDEASMVSDALYQLLLEKCKENNTKLVFVGDIAQLQPVKGNDTSKVFECTNIATLSTMHRQSEDSDLLTVLSELRSVPKYTFEPNPKIERVSLQQFVNNAVEDFKKHLNVKILAFTNNRVANFNNSIKKILFGESDEYYVGEILTAYENYENPYKEMFWNSSDYVISDVVALQKKLPGLDFKVDGYALTFQKEEDYPWEKSCYILSNSMNREIYDQIAYTIEGIRLKALKNPANWLKYYQLIKSFATPFDLEFDNRIVKKKTFDLGYACTVHKSQGSTYDKVYVDLNDILTCKDDKMLRQLEYVAFSRTKNLVTIYDNSNS